MDIMDLVERVFKDEVKPANSIQVNFEGMDNTINLFETFITIFTEGMKIHFVNNGNVDLNSITQENFITIVGYFASIGVLLNYHKFHVKQLEKMENNNSPDTLSYSYDLQDKDVTNDFIKNNYKDTPSPNLFIKYKTIKSDRLPDYKFQIRVLDNIYVIYFEFL